jgi:hypothetical protein
VRERLASDHDGVASLGTASLTVRAREAPIAGACIDLEIVRRDGMPERDHRVRGATYATDALGMARHDVNPNEPCEAFLYAPGHAPRRVMWQSDLTIDLAPFDAHARFAPLAPGEHLRVKPVGSPGALAVLYPDHDGAAEGDLVAGAYDAVVVGRDGAAVRMVSFEVARHGRALVALGRDDRPIITLPAPKDRLPAGCEWGVTVQRDRGGEPWPDVGDEAQVDRSDPTVFTIRLCGTGTFAIGTIYANVPWRRVSVRAGDRVALEAPEESATLNLAGGRMATVTVVLRNDDPLGWNPTIGYPDYRNNVATIKALPPGRYHAFRHFASDHWSKANAFSGAPIVLEAGKTTTLRAFEEDVRGSIAVVLKESDGSPVQDATLFVEDPARPPARADTIVCTLGADLVGPPLGPRVRVINGLVNLPAMPAGQLLLRIVRDDGTVFTCARDVVPGGTLAITLPPPR